MSGLFDQVCTAISSIRVAHIEMEYDLQAEVAMAFDQAGICYEKECRLGPRNRVDFFIDGIAVELKKGRPNRQKVIDQLHRYAGFGCVQAVILVLQNSMQVPLSRVSGKPCRVIGLQKLWGIAL